MEVIPSVDKSPKKYDKYETKLSKVYLEIAEKALHETESIRTQSLAQMREWISKDPYIKKCRTDALFLIRYLRAKKFNVPAACTLYQKYLINRQVYPDWFKSLDVDDPHLVELLHGGFFVPLPDRDSRGRQVILHRFSHLNADKFTSTDVFRVQEMLHQTMYDDEETQIAGFVYIFDYRGITMKHVAMFSLVDFKNYTKMVRSGCPVRMTSLLVLNMPAFLQAFYEITMAAMQQKVRDRFKMFKSLEDFQKEVDIDIFPEEYGGKMKTENIISEIHKKMQTKREKILALDEMLVDVPKDMNGEWYQQSSNGNIQAGVIGSFRKLDLD